MTGWSRRWTRAQGWLPRPLRRLSVLLTISLVLVVGAAISPLIARHPTRPGQPTRAAALDGRDRQSLGRAIALAQQRLKLVPKDWPTWAQLGAAYVQQARITADPAYYPKAETALTESLRLQPDQNWQALAGLGALANARHDFHAGRDLARRAQRINPYGGSIYGVLADALTELGDYPGAERSIQRMLDVQPGIAAFARASYYFESHGQVDRAREALQRALVDSTDPADIAFCRYYLGDLAFHNGNPRAALAHYERGIAADPDYQPLRGGQARAWAALGLHAKALAAYSQAVRAVPLPQLLTEYGDLLTAGGRHQDARRQYDVLAAQRQILLANGVTDHLGDAVFLADHGDPQGALTAARAEWQTRHSVLTADALAWALYRAGRYAEALPYARRATSLGWRNATFLYHRGAIHRALGQLDAAGTDLRRAIAINPHFDTLQAPQAQRMLAGLKGTA